MLHRLFQALGADRRGALTVEVAFAMLVLSGLLMSGIEITRYVLLNQKIERASSSVADLVARAEVLAEADLADIFVASNFVVQPFDIAGQGRVIISSISVSGGAPAEVNWQRSFGAGSGSSTFGSEDGAATLPSGFSLNNGESAIAVEAFYDFVPMFAPETIAATQIYRYSVLRPRFGSLTSVSP